MIQTSLHWASPLSLGVAIGVASAVLVAYVALRKVAGAPIAPARRRGLWALRGLIFAVLVVILLNPVRVEETPGPVERAKVVYLVDSSQSMALGESGNTRWDQVRKTVRSADERRDPRTGAQVDLFRFGSRLAAVDGPFWNGPEPPSPVPSNGPGTATAAAVARPDTPPPSPTDPETLLAGSLEALAGRFGQAPPRAVVVFSDGRARDPERAEAIARGYARMNVPISAVPVGDDGVGGDVAVVSMVAPAQARKSSQVPVSVFVRSYGYKGKRADLTLAAAGPDGKPGTVLARTPVTLQDGLAGYSLTFPSGEVDLKVVASIPPQAGEVSADNNTFSAEVAIDHTKIRVLYVEGSVERFVTRRGGVLGFGGTQEVQGAYSSLQQALMEDPDVECTAVTPTSDGDFSVWNRTDERGRGLPETPSELFAYDALILSNVPREALSDPHLAWIDDWVARRGGGLMMVGGPHAFGSGRWAATSVGKMLPLEVADGRDWDGAMTTLSPVGSEAIHPAWHIAADDSENRALRKTLPGFVGHNRVGPPKPTAEVLARFGAGPGGAAGFAAQPYGRGRTMALAVGITRRFSPEFTQSWGGVDARYYKKFWRNVAYWLTENSSIGRRRLLAETDKRLYRPGEPIVVKAKAFDENAAPTLDYRVAVSVEPRAADGGVTDLSPLTRPAGTPRPAGGTGPFLPWGEEFDLGKLPGESSYTSSLPVAEAKSLPAGVALTGGLRIELTAYEGNTQVDSTALDVQVLDDPGEQQNPLPDHDLLARVAAASGGQVLRGPGDLAKLLNGLPVSVGAPEVKTMPAWSRGWLMTLLLGLLTVEWVWRRRVGLA